jgi:hypothetical protein
VHGTVAVEKEEAVPRGSPSPSLREVRARLGSGGAGAGVRLEGDDLARASLRSSAPRQRLLPMLWYLFCYLLQIKSAILSRITELVL